MAKIKEAQTEIESSFNHFFRSFANKENMPQKGKNISRENLYKYVLFTE